MPEEAFWTLLSELYLEQDVRQFGQRILNFNLFKFMKKL
jgi:hypothetical protein